MASKSITSADRRSAFPKNNALNNIVYGSTEQVISITDIISEGPILGLAKGGKSVFLNNDAIFEDNDVGYVPVGGESISGTYGTNTITVKDWEDNSYSYDPGVVDTQFILIHDLYTKTSSELTHNSTVQTSVSYNIVGALPTGTLIQLTYTGTDLPTAIAYGQANRSNGLFDQQLQDGKGWAVIKGDDDREVAGWVEAVDQTNNTVKIYVNGIPGLDRLDWLETADLELNISLTKGISSISSSGSITLDSNLPLTFSNKSFSISAPVSNSGGNNPYNRKYDSSGYQFRPGTMDQNPIETLQGVGSSTTTLSAANVTTLNIGTTASIIEANVNSGEIDLVQLNFKYPGGLYLTNTEKGTKEDAGAGYVIELFLQTNTQGSGYGWESQGFLAGNGTISSNLISDLSQATSYSSWSSKVAAGRGLFKHGGKYTSAVNFTHSINLEPFQPFAGFKLEITRITESENFTDLQSGRGHTWPNLTWRGSDVDKWQAVQSGGIETAFGVIKEKLNFPYTAVANVTFNSKQFPNTPARTYDCFGLKVKVPHNYTTREELGLNTDGSYKNVDDLYNELFNGTFREGKVYTDNPAWIFYDILTNNRYGIGEFLKEDPATARNVDIDIYSLYRIARYADELVSDGKGGLEPRFRANLYFQKAADVFKVLKDMATIFRGMLYWMDGKLVPIMDEKKSPVYAFNRSNVMDGAFEYQSTGSKTRANQVIVSWNNPKTDYKLEPVIIEDRENIIRTGKIVKENANAFGCTSEGQAVRYGRWKLWTAINQTEIVAFKSAINAAFLAPGDIITIQDNHDFNYRASGRITGVNSLSSTSMELTLDRNAQSGATGSYPTTDDLLSTLIIDDKVVLGQASATIGSTAYTRGDVVSAAPDEDGTSVSFTGTETQILSKINNAYDDSGNMLSLQYSKESVVYDCAITAVDSSTNKITITLPYASAPVEVGNIWGIKDSIESTVSPKEYKILAIAVENDNTFGITAVEYYESKFDAVDNNFTLAVDDPVRPPITPGSKIPAPKNIRVLRTPKFNSPGEEIIVVWDPPAVTETFAEYITQYEFESNIPGYPSSSFTPTTSYSFDNVPDGQYTFRVKSITEDGKKSAAVSAEVVIEDIFGGNFARIYGLVKGGYVSAPVAITHDTSTPTYNFQFENTPVYFYAYTDASSSSRAFSTWPIDYKPLKDNSKTAYVFVDYYSSTVKLANYKFDEDLDIDYWYDEIEQSKIDLNAAAVAGGGSAIYSNPSIWSQVNGTISIPAGSNKVTGVNTSFTGSAYALTNVLKFEVDSGPANQRERAAKIAYVESDTVLYIDRVFDIAVSNKTFYKDSLSPDFSNDFLAGSLNGGTGAYQSFLVLDPDLTKPRDLVVDTNISSLQYKSDETQYTPRPSSISITATGLNFTLPEFKITGTGFNSTSGSADSSFVTASSGTYSKQIHNNSAIAWNNGATLEFTIEVREKNDPNNSIKNITKTLRIFKTKDGAIGLSGKSAKLKAEDYTILYNENGASPFYNDYARSAWGLSEDDKIYFSLLYNNFTTPIYKFTRTVGGSSTVVQNWTDTFDGGGNLVPGWGYLLPYKYTPSATFSQSDWPVNLQIEIGEKPSSWSSGTAPTTIEATDSISLVGVKSGTGGVVVHIANSAHSYVTDKNGNVGTGTTGTITNSNTKFEVLLGGTRATYVGYDNAYGSSTSDSNLTAGQWYIASATNTGGDLTISPPTNNDNSRLTIGDHTAINSSHSSGNPTDDVEVITYTVKIKTHEGLQTVEAQQTLTKSIAGIDGASTIEMFLLTSSASAPSSRPEVTYTFASGAIAATSGEALNSWSSAASSVTATNRYLWKVSKRVVPSGAETTINIGTTSGDTAWEGPVLAATFGDVGEDGRTIVLEPSKHVINYDTAGAEATTVTFTTTAFGVNSSNTAYYKWFIGGVLYRDGTGQASPSGGTSNSASFTLPDSSEPAIGNSVKVTVELWEGTSGSNAVERAQDSVTIYAVQDGQDAITGFLTNNNHSVVADNNGTNYSLSDAGGTFKVYKGGSLLSSGVTFSGNSTSNGLSIAINSSTGAYTLSGGSWTTNAVTFTLTATVAAATAGAANNVVITQVYSITKSRKGDTGTGTAGDDAPRIATGFVYSTQNSIAPGASVNARYSFTGTPGFTSLNTNWSETPPTFNSTNNVIYYSKYTAVEEVNASNVPQGDSDEGSGLTFGSVQTGTSFTGLVTFASGDFSTGGSTITTIDGGNIAAETITANKLTIGDTGRTSSRLLLLEDSVKIFEGTTLRVHLGNLSNNTT